MAVEVWSDKNGYSVYGAATPIATAILFKLDHVGDFVLAVDAILAFRARFPAADLTLVCAPWNLPVARALGVFGDIVTIAFFDERAEGGRHEFDASFAAALPKRHFDLAVDLRIDPDTRVFLDHVSATHTCGYESTFNRKPLTLTLPWRLGPDAETNLAAHQALLMLRLVHSVGDFFAMSAAVPALIRERIAAPSDVDLGFAAGRVLVVCNTSSGRAAKNWPAERFRELVAWLCRDLGVAVLLVGTADGRRDAEAILAAVNSPLVASAVGRTSLAEAVGLVAEASMFIGNDSGLTHIAGRLGIPTLDIMSGIDPAGMWVPIGPRVTVVKAPVPCSPCHIFTLSQCRHGHACIRNIGLDLVQALVREAVLGCEPRPVRAAPPSRARVARLESV